MHKVLKHHARENIFHSFLPKDSKKLSRNMVIRSSEMDKIKITRESKDDFKITCLWGYGSMLAWTVWALVKGTLSAFTPCLHVKYFFRVSPQSANSQDSLYNCTNIPQAHRRSRGGHRQAPGRGVGLAPEPAETHCASQLQNHPQVLPFERQGRRAKLVFFPSSLTMKCQAYCSSYYSQLFIHPGSNPS